MRRPITGTLPSGKSFEVDLRLNHPSLLPGVQVLSEEVLLKTGKKLRPRIMFMMGEAIGVAFESLAPYARIVELVHAATLAHDDVIDQATLRRGKPTLNDQLTQARAVLSGDLLLSRSMVELAELGSLPLLKRMAEVLEALVSGEWLQLEGRGSLDVNTRTLETIAKLKTASMLEWAAEVPFHLKNADSRTLEMARAFGRHLGIAFQSVDDCLDFSRESGKDFVKDLKEGQLNQVSRLLLDAHPEWERSFDFLIKHCSEPTSQASIEKAMVEVRGKASLNADLARQALRELQPFGLNQNAFKDLDQVLKELLKRKK
ncbi:MAG: polyprenyl synthetase family protein [Bdellovibrionales bacterium]|nr:polyprenyl synthetase family protein [Oligoflexia bacterium]